MSRFRLLTRCSAGYTKWGLSWTYDRYGNASAETQTYDTPPHYSISVSATTNRITTSGYGYDTNGNMTSDGYNTLVYDAENRVVSATNGSSSGTYTLDGNSLRVKKVSGSATTVYIFSGSKVIAEYDNGAALTSPSREYIYSGGALLAKIVSGTTTYYHQDHLSNRIVTNSSGTVVEQLGTYPFGESWYNASNDKLLFTSYERDAESGNDYAMARSYINRLGKFSSLDPLGGSAGDPQTLNAYTYTGNDPTDLVDPEGMFMAVPPGCTSTYPFAGGPGELVCSPPDGGWTDTGVITGLPLLYMGGRHGGGARGNNSGKGDSDTCKGLRGKSTRVIIPGHDPSTFRISFDDSGYLNGVSVNFGNTFNQLSAGGQTFQIDPGTTIGLTWSNGPLPGSFEIGATRPVGIITEENLQVSLSKVKFGGSFGVEGRAYGLPFTSGAIENRMNSDFATVLKATNFANWLAGLKIPCASLESFFPIK